MPLEKISATQNKIEDSHVDAIFLSESNVIISYYYVTFYLIENISYLITSTKKLNMATLSDHVAPN